MATSKKLARRNGRDKPARAKGATRGPKPKGQGLGWPFWTLGSLVVAAIVVFGGIFRDAGLVAAAAPTLLVLTGLTQLRRLRRVKWGEAEVDLMAEAQEVARDGKTTIAEVRQLAATLANVSLSTLARSQLHGEFPWSQRMKIREDVKAQLRGLGLPEAGIAEADQMFRSVLRYLHAGRVVNAAKAERYRKSEGRPAAERNAVQKDLERYLHFPTLSVPPPAVLRRILADDMTDEVDARLRDFEHYEATGTMRAPDMFDSAHARGGDE